MALLLLVELSGCSLAGLDPDSLMRPPRPTGEKKDIHRLLENRAGSDITLKYPAAGDYRSAVIMHDITGDGQEEAIALYQKSSDTSGVNVMFIQKLEGEWREIGSFVNTATQVDRVCFGDVNGDGRDEAVFGWGSSQNGTATVSVYAIKNGKMDETDLIQTYNEMTVSDFDCDGNEEIFIASVTLGDQDAVAHLIRITDGAIEIMGSVNLDKGVTKYVSLSQGLLSADQPGVILDGSKSSNTMVTEIVYWDRQNKMLVAPFFDKAQGSAFAYMERKTTVVSGDVNNDSILEFPMVQLLPGFSVDTPPDETSYMTSWMHYRAEEKRYTRVESVVINFSGGYWLLFPDIWQERITTRLDVKNRSLTFYEWLADSAGSGVLGDPLLKIQVFTQRDWDKQKGTLGFEKLMEFNGQVYAASILSPSNKLTMKINDVKNSFKLLKQ